MTFRPCKPWWRSRTFNVNALAAVLAALEAQFNLLSELLPHGWQPWAMLALALVNAYLRTVTTQPMVWRGDGRYFERGQ